MVRWRRRGHFVLVILVEGTHVSGVMRAGQRVVVVMMVVMVRVMVDRTEPAGVGAVRLGQHGRIGDVRGTEATGWAHQGRLEGVRVDRSTGPGGAAATTADGQIG